MSSHQPTSYRNRAAGNASCMDCEVTDPLTRYRCAAVAGDFFGCPRHYDQHATICKVCPKRQSDDPPMVDPSTLVSRLVREFDAQQFEDLVDELRILAYDAYVTSGLKDYAWKAGHIALKMAHEAIRSRGSN